MSSCYDFQKWTIVSLSAVAVSLTIGLVMQYAHGQPCTYKDINGVCTEVANNYFSINIPDSWTYIEYSSTGMSQLLGRGPVDEIHLTPSEFSDILLTGGDFRNAIEKLQDEDSLYAIFAQDTNYPIKNAPLESYVKYKIDKLGIQNITSQQYTTVGKEKAATNKKIIK